MYTNSNRHRMMTEEFPFKTGDSVSFRTGKNMIAHAEIFKVLSGTDIIVQFGNGAVGLEYVDKSRIIRE